MLALRGEGGNRNLVVFSAISWWDRLEAFDPLPAARINFRH
jgi:hypothetical protein